MVDELIEGLIRGVGSLSYRVFMALRDEDVESVVGAPDVVVLPFGISDGALTSGNRSSPLYCYELL